MKEDKEMDEEEDHSEGQEAELDAESIDDWEEGFEKGFVDDTESECSYCHQILIEEGIVEMEVKGQILKFCNNECAEEYKKKNKEE